MSNIITIDGPASSGKDSVGSLFASKINYQFIDTGAIYRSGCFVILRLGIDIEDEQKCADVFANLKIEFNPGQNGKPTVLIDGKDETANLHTQEINSVIATIAAHPKARKKCSQIQREIGGRIDTVMSGRDIGSEIFPNAKLKFFITASPEVRAKRRFNQLIQKYPDLTYNEVLAQTKDRDKKDSERKASPMRVPDGAVVVDTTEKNIEESVAVLMENYDKIFK